MDHHRPEEFFPPVSPYAAGRASKCPRCGRGAVYQGFLKVAKECSVCGLDLSGYDPADGPAVFIMFIVGFVVVAAAIAVEVAFEPPLWLHAIIWLPLTIVLCLAMLRPIKATMIALEYHHRAAEGRLDDGA